MTDEEFLPLAEMREHCGLPGAMGDGDSALRTHRAAVAARIESITGRKIITAEGVKAESAGTVDDRFLIFASPDMQIPDTGIELQYRPPDMGPGLETLGRHGVDKGMIESRKRDFRVLSSGVPSRDMNVPYIAYVTLGMPARALPPEFRSAGLFMVRELFEGSAMDQIDKGSILDSLLRDHQIPRMTALLWARGQAGLET